MCSQSQLKLPLVNFSDENLKPGTSQWLATCGDVRRAMEEYGCFEAVYSRVNINLHNSVFANTADLFDLPIEVKKRNQSEKPYFSYYGQYKFIPLYESLGIDNPTLQGTKSFTSLMWPQNHHLLFCQTVEKYSELNAELDRLVMKMLCESYGLDLDSYYDDLVGKTNYLLRFFKYRVPEKDETIMGLTPHTDKTMLSIIHANHVGGLQVRAKDDHWIDVEIPPSSYIVMAGDALMAWSNDRIPSCYHQVIMKEKEIRYSTGMFSFITGTVRIPQELADDCHPMRYKPFDHFSFLHFDQENKHKKFPNSIKAYCGI